ncbi:hypothetical protein FAI41_01820 [Acetobacteraceae bacterium]|nr:hypothetical protein FAI41_01820 [Acetobacteraceae bacterium]
MSRKPQKTKKVLPPIKEEEIPYTLPEGWKWVRLIEIISVLSPPEKIPASKYKQEGLYPIIDQSQKEISGYTNNEKILVIPENGIVVFGDHTRVVKLLYKPFAQGADGIKLLKTHSCVLPQYLQYYLETNPVKDLGYRRHFPLLKQCLFPLPPLEVQKKIVVILEARFEKLDSARAGLEKILPEIKAFRQAVLQRAMQGKLVLQEANDEPASLLLEKIKAEQAGQKKRKILAPIKEEEIPYTLPEGWKWVRLIEIISVLSPPEKIPASKYKQEGLYPIIDQSQKEISGYTNNEKILVIPENGIVVFGDHTRVVKLLYKPFAQGADGIKLLKTHSCVLPQYLQYYLETNPVKDLGYRRHFPLLKQCLFPLPPLEVQKRIVAKIEHSFAYAEKLEIHIQQALDNLAPLKQAWLKEAFSGKIFY